MDFLWAMIPGGGLTALIIGGVGLFFYLKQLKAQENEVPPLDLVDAKKVDELVSKQVEIALKPLLQSEGYSEIQVQEILTRTSLGQKTFRR